MKIRVSTGEIETLVLRTGSRYTDGTVAPRVRTPSPRPWAVLLALFLPAACQPNLDIGGWTCSEDGSESTIPKETAPVTLPWSTGFENRYCDYTELAGFCYAIDSASYELVTSPVHSGDYAAAFTVRTADGGESQARCVRQGELPTAAYYGAWYYITEAASSPTNWNLFHFRGGSNLPLAPGFLDVSLVTENDALRVAVFGMRHRALADAADSPAIPIGEWFHVQLYLKRASGTDGEVALYVNDQEVFDAKNVTTDDGASLGLWFLGNLATDLTPSDATLYVDDVTISETL